MKPSSKDRMTVLIILGVFILVLAGMGYVIFGNPKITGIKTAPTVIVKADDLQQIEMYKKHIVRFAIKVHENNEFYLKYYAYDYDVPYESKFILNADLYNKLVENKEYQFKVKFTKHGDRSNGTIQLIYND
jgi:hypothetical protein